MSSIIGGALWLRNNPALPGNQLDRFMGFGRQLHADPQGAAVREADAIHGVQICASGHDATTALKRFMLDG
jgi:hypothetical protein